MQSNLLPEAKLYIWDVESDNVCYLNFTNGKLSFEEVAADGKQAEDTSDDEFSLRR